VRILVLVVTSHHTKGSSRQPSVRSQCHKEKNKRETEKVRIVERDV
jgi:hypothetical protein